MIRIFGTAIFAIIIGASSASAQASLREYFCKMQYEGSFGWIAPEMAFFYTPGQPQAAVFDGFIYRANDQKPIAARIRSERGDKVRFSYRLNLTSSNAQRIRVLYNGIFDVKTLEMRMDAILTGTRQSEFASGKCALQG